MSELIRTMAESLVNEIMDAQADDACEAGNRRNGYRERKLTTSVGTISLRIPKLRSGTYFPGSLAGLYRFSSGLVIVSTMMVQWHILGVLSRICCRVG